MPRTKRRAQLGTLESFEEDLFAARERGGIARCDDDTLAGILAVLARLRRHDELASMLPHLPGESDLDCAKRVLRTSALDVCRAHELDGRSGTDKRDAAAAVSLRTLLLRQTSTPYDYTSRRIRRAAADEFAIERDPDTVRSREDNIIKSVARRAWDSLLNPSRGRLRTANDLIEAIRIDVRFARHALHMAILARENADRQEVRGYLTLGLVKALWLQWLAVCLVGQIEFSYPDSMEHLRPWREQRGSVVLRNRIDCALMYAIAMGQAKFGDGHDALLAFLLPLFERGEPFESCLKLVREDPALAKTLATTEVLVDQCSDCFYERSYNGNKMCTLHRFATLLMRFEVVVCSDTVDPLNNSIAADLVAIRTSSRLLRIG